MLTFWQKYVFEDFRQACADCNHPFLTSLTRIWEKLLRARDVHFSPYPERFSILTFRYV